MKTSKLVLALFLGQITFEEVASVRVKEQRRYDDGHIGLPWEANDFWNHNDEQIEKHLEYYSNARKGIVKSQKEQRELEEKQHKEQQEAFNRQKFTVPKDLIVDDSGTKYTSTHQCYGSPCKEDKPKLPRFASVQLESEQPLGAFEAERDSLAGYPSEWTTFEHPANDKKELRQFVHKYIEPKTGRLKTEFEVGLEDAQAAEKKFQEAAQKPYFRVPSDMINDWTGHRYVTTHRCFGERCQSDIDKGILLQTSSEVGKRMKSKFAYGDAERERDEENGYPSAMDLNEDLHKHIKSHINEKTGGLKSLSDFEAAEEKRLQEAAKKPAFKVTDGMIDDWPGTRFTTTHQCFGKPCEPDHSLLQVRDII